MLKRVYIEITNQCNLSCSFCPPTLRRIEYMDESLFSVILDQLQGITKYIYFHIKGEPLLHPKLVVFIELCATKGFLVNITSNGTLIEAWESQLLGLLGLRQISFSLQSFEDDKEQLELYMNPIIHFANNAIKENIKIELRLWNLYTLKEKGTLNQHILKKIQQGFAIDGTIKEELILDKGIKLKENLYLSQSYEFKWPDLAGELVSACGTCYGLRQQLGILVDGTVVPCCLDHEAGINLGNVSKTTITDILNSQRVKTIVEGFQQRKIIEPLCQKCGYRQRFD